MEGNGGKIEGDVEKDGEGVRRRKREKGDDKMECREKKREVRKELREWREREEKRERNIKERDWSIESCIES